MWEIIAGAPEVAIVAVAVVFMMVAFAWGVLKAYRIGMQEIDKVRVDAEKRDDIRQAEITALKVDLAKNYASIPKVEAMIARLDATMTGLSERIDSLVKVLVERR